MKKLRISLSAKIFWGFVIILFPILLTFLAGYRSNKEHLQRLAFDDLAIMAEAYEGQVYQFMEMSRQRALDFSSDGFIRDTLKEIVAGSPAAGAVNALNGHLARSKKPLDKAIYAVHIASLDGKIRASTESVEIGRDVSGEPFFIKGREGLSIVEGMLLPPTFSGLAVSSPLTDRMTGAVIGVLINMIQLTELDRVLKGGFHEDAQPYTGLRKSPNVLLINRDKAVIAASVPSKDAAMGRTIDAPAVNNCLQSGRESSGIYRNYEGAEVAGASICIPSMKWVLTVEMAKDEVLAPAALMRRQAAIVGLSVISLVGLLMVLFYRTVVRPVETVSEAAEAIAEGDFRRRLHINTGDEIEKLADSINNMALGIEGSITNLEEMVRHRTEELAAANEEMTASNEELQAAYAQLEVTTSDLEEANSSLAVANDELKNLERLKTDFLHTISHELRSPLSPILGYLELMREGGIGELTPKQKSAVTEMQICARNMHVLVDELLEVASIEAGSLSQDFREIDLYSVIRQAIKDVSGYAEEMSIGIETKLPGDSILLMGDRKSICGIFIHLLRNAVKFSLRGGNVTVEAFPKENGVEVTVSDRGIGIPKDKLDKIFEVFYQVESSAARRYEGVGLGLYLVKRLIGLHNGSIRVESEEGKGTVFTVFIPRCGIAGSTVAGFQPVKTGKMPVPPDAAEARDA